MPGNRPDFSNFLAHFTRDGEPFGNNNPRNDRNEFSGMNAGERLVSILNGRRIRASGMPWTNQLTICFTECPWASLLDHANQYSSYAVGFSKPCIFAAGGGPAYYVRADRYLSQHWEPDVFPFVTPFWPPYTPRRIREDHLDGRTVDYSHEREWRIPRDFRFEYNQVEFVILPGYREMAEFPSDLKDSIGRDKFLLMDQYRTVERLWPVHNIN